MDFEAVVLRVLYVCICVAAALGIYLLLVCRLALVLYIVQYSHEVLLRIFSSIGEYLVSRVRCEAIPNIFLPTRWPSTIFCAKVLWLLPHADYSMIICFLDEMGRHVLVDGSRWFWRTNSISIELKLFNPLARRLRL